MEMLSVKEKKNGKHKFAGTKICETVKVKKIFHKS